MNNHSLLIADTYLELRRAEQRGQLVIHDWGVERPVPPHVRADLFVNVEYPAQQRRSSYYLEADLGTEPLRIIREKIDKYWQAVELSSDDYFPYVVFVVNDGLRMREFARLFGGLDEERSEMVKVQIYTRLIPYLIRL
ncbi:replication-relaxation family protein [Streptomyces nigra]